MNYPGEADEAQHRHYNDGQFINPYDSYPPPPPPPPPPFPPLVGGFIPYAQPESPTMHYRNSLPSMYEPHEDHDDDSGSHPLLNRPSSSQPRLSFPPQLDQQDDQSPVLDDFRSDSNVRYGRIPQRVPRRYKTLKKVEYVLFLSLYSPLFRSSTL